MADVHDILQSYIQYCIDKWCVASEAVRSEAEKHLSPRYIASTVAEAWMWNDGHGRFIPMPTDRARTGSFFFLPIQGQSYPTVVLSFELLVLKTGKCIAFRFEPSEPEGRHGYSHVQMCRRLRGISSSIPGLAEWMPDSYPAFPSPANDALGIFLAMATSVHGFGEGGLLDLIPDLFPNRPLCAKNYIGTLRKLIDATLATA